MNARVTMRGPLLDGLGPAIVHRSTVRMADDIADEGVSQVRQQLGRVLKHPTGYYSSRVVKTRRSDGAAVTDSRVVYGPWLEGVGSRNQTTRFKGYHTFRLVAQQLGRDVARLTRADVQDMIRELNGGN